MPLYTTSKSGFDSVSMQGGGPSWGTFSTAGPKMTFMIAFSVVMMRAALDSPDFLSFLLQQSFQHSQLDAPTESQKEKSQFIPELKVVSGLFEGLT